ncbi:hypothetical protein OG427_17835 [Streptomyces sp. NBC_00133]|uniref:hypothetical protein n=1 Tax=Streptomyces sp. NBC_00133 TaxID=2903624 RepID=UPI003245F480
MVHKPAWFRDGEVFVSYAPTVGINKDGEELYVIDAATGTRTGEIDDRLAQDVTSLVDEFETTETSRWVKLDPSGAPLVPVPIYYDNRPLDEFNSLMDSEEFRSFEGLTIGEMLHRGLLVAMNGHGSPSADFRTGHIPYIKVSDIRAGQVNINPTNRVPRIVAERFWKGEKSGLRAYDLITPIRTSKNIGEFAVIMPGQEQVVLTKEMLILRAGKEAPFDNFYLLWALTLKAVRRQWDRIVFMQTNREDVGSRYLEITLPVPPNRSVADEFSKAFREYYLGIEKLRDGFLGYLSADDRHHVFMSSAEVAEPEDEEEAGD